MGLDKDRESIKELQASVRQLQDLLVAFANGVSALRDEIKELKEDHIALRQQFVHSAVTGISSAE